MAPTEVGTLLLAPESDIPEAPPQLPANPRFLAEQESGQEDEEPAEDAEPAEPAEPDYDDYAAPGEVADISPEDVAALVAIARRHRAGM